MFETGQCWAMEGSHGYLLVKLGAPIHISGVSFQLGRAVKDASSAPRLVSVSVDPYVEPLLNKTTIPQGASELTTFMLPQPTPTTHSLVKIEVSSFFVAEFAAQPLFSHDQPNFFRSLTTMGIPHTLACIG